jgi:hypothetical protein
MLSRNKELKMAFSDNIEIFYDIKFVLKQLVVVVALSRQSYSESQSYIRMVVYTSYYMGRICSLI